MQLAVCLCRNRNEIELAVAISFPGIYTGLRGGTDQANYSSCMLGAEEEPRLPTHSSCKFAVKKHGL